MARRTELAAGPRPVVAESWRRCAEGGAHPESGWLPPVRLAPDVLRDYRDAHPLGRLLPMFDELLGCGAGDAHVFAVTDERGTLLWVRGDPRTARRVERM
ncbi:MAG TPA: transcriptional regulator, partial [Rugosimonospora sp.]|nr:transcriptional regulator [Rugosimonospora sp.]